MFDQALLNEAHRINDENEENQENKNGLSQDNENFKNPNSFNDSVNIEQNHISKIPIKRMETSVNF